MAKRKSATKAAKQAADGQNGGIVSLTKELFQAAITLRGSVEPADYKRYVLAEEEVAFDDAIAENAERVYDEGFLRDWVHDVVQTIKRNLKVDWTEPHRDQVRAEIRAAVRPRRQADREVGFGQPESDEGRGDAAHSGTDPRAGG